MRSPEYKTPLCPRQPTAKLPWFITRGWKVLCCLLFALAGSSNNGLFADETRPVTQGPKSSAEILRNIPYVVDGHPQQILDLHLPERESDRPIPLLIWIHGGAWLGGNHSNPPMLHLLGKGFAVASIEYRFSQHAIWPAQSHDCKAAIRHLRANAKQFGLDADRFAVAGDSAGGHLAAFMGTSGSVAALEGDLGNPGVSSHVQAVIDFYGPTDLTLMAAQSDSDSIIDHDAADSPESRLMGGPIQSRHELARTANPITTIDANDPPFLILHGDKDRLVPHAQSVILANALIEAGVEVTMKTITGAGHGGPRFHDAQTRRLMEDFLFRTLDLNR